MANTDPRPFLVLSVVVDASARPAALTRSHGDALERALKATAGLEVAGLDIVELPIAAPAFSALRKQLGRDPSTVGLYDLFPLSSHIDQGVRRVAGQFLAAEALWALEEQGALGGVPVHVKFATPAGWSSNPRELQERLVKAEALDLSPQGIETFKQAKSVWDAHVSP